MSKDSRLEKARALSAAVAYHQDLGAYEVPSQSNGGSYLVLPSEAGGYSCECPDNAEAGNECKHILAVRISLGELRAAPEPASSGQERPKRRRAARKAAARARAAAEAEEEEGDDGGSYLEPLLTVSRSISPDGYINSTRINVSFSIKGKSREEIEELALLALEIQESAIRRYYASANQTACAAQPTTGAEAKVQATATAPAGEAAARESAPAGNGAASDLKRGRLLGLLSNGRGKDALVVKLADGAYARAYGAEIDGLLRQAGLPRPEPGAKLALPVLVSVEKGRLTALAPAPAP